MGTLGFFGEQGPALRAAFCARLDLADPGISWLTSRDRVVEQSLLLAMVTGTLARIGNEVMELQRTELGELREGSDASVVGSITMPHKRNPERSEHLDTLARLTRAHAGVMLEAMVQLHERDGRGWKAEWPTFPELHLLTSTALALGLDLVRTIEVDVDRMRANVLDDDLLLSEQVLGAYAARVGKHRAQQELQTVLAAARADGRSLGDAVVAAGVVDAADVASLAAPSAIPTAEVAVDVVTERVTRLLAATEKSWP